MRHTNTDPDIPVIHEDDHVLVVDKPHDVLSQADETGDPDLLSLCKTYLDSSYLGLVHRLDRPTGGLMVFAKTPNAARFLSEQFRNRTLQKTYWAVVQGNPPQNGVLTHYLRKDRALNRVEIVKAAHPDAMDALLSYQRIGQDGGEALLSIHLQTGRPHQVRVQLAEEGFPVWGDYKYGLNQPDGRTLALRSVKLSFRHPEHREFIDFVLPPPTREPWSKYPVQELLS